MRYRLRTLLIVLALGPLVLTAIVLYAERSWNEFMRWRLRKIPSVAPKTYGS